MLRDQIQSETVTAMKAKDKERTAALRLIGAKIKDRDIELRTADTKPEDDELVIIIREVYCDPSQINEISFPARNSSKSHGYIPNTTLGMGLGATTDGSRDTVSVKDWSSDDTEPGDDEAFTPVLHRIINPSQDDGEDEF